MRDHLGNNRIVADASGAVVQSTQYYPFGMTFAEQVGRSLQPYKYNGKELDEMNDLNQYDYSARYYDPAEIRFTTIDPLAEKYYSISPYVYVANNPLKYIDPTGMSPEDDEKKEKESFLQSIYNAFNQMMEGVVYTIGFHPDQMNSENPAVREDARQRRENTQEALHTANETLLSIVPAGEVTYKKLNDREISASEYGWAAAELTPVGKVGKLGKSISVVPEIGRKLDYVFGKATGRLHNLERSTTMQRQLNSIGIYDNRTGRGYLKGELGKVLNSSDNILKRDGAHTIRESLLMGPNGGLYMESRWDGGKLNTIILKGRY